MHFSGILESSDNFDNHKMETSFSTCATFSLTSFAFNLFAKLIQGTSERNVLISPFSIAAALALVQAGTLPSSSAHKQFKMVLGSLSHVETASLSKEISSTTSASNDVQFVNANGLWCKHLLETYVNTVSDEHNALAADLPETFDTIDEFITLKTNGLIQNTMTGPIHPLTVAVLVNAVFFKGQWFEQFDPTFTSDGTFTTTDGVEKRGPFMKAERNMRVSFDSPLLGGANIVQLNYMQNSTTVWNGANIPNYAAYFILPQEPGIQSFSNLITSLVSLARESEGERTNFIRKLSNDLTDRKVILKVPRFQVSYGTKSIAAELKDLGLTEIFSDGSLVQMSDDPLVHLDDVLHKATVKISEEGTVAAAASVGIVMTRSLPVLPPRLYFDRPFVFMIFHVPTGTPLFLSKVDDPSFL